MDENLLFGGTPKKELMERPYKRRAVDHKTSDNLLVAQSKSRLNLEQPHEQVRCCSEKLAYTGLSTDYAQKLWTAQLE